jgi:hypothetical protein
LERRVESGNGQIGPMSLVGGKTFKVFQERIRIDCGTLLDLDSADHFRQSGGRCQGCRASLCREAAVNHATPFDLEIER